MRVSRVRACVFLVTRMIHRRGFSTLVQFYSRDVFCSTVATCTIMYVIMRGGACVGRASEAVNIVKCLLLETILLW